jgi:hypothetical protein
MKKIEVIDAGRGRWKMIEWRRVFTFEDGVPQFEVPCRESGEPLPDYVDLVKKLQVEVELGMLIDQGVRKYSFNYEPACIVCVCGRGIQLKAASNLCVCGRLYGQQGRIL